MNENDLTELTKLLGCLYYLYGKLLTVENEKTEVLTRGNINELTELMNNEQAILMESRNIEKSRMALCKKTAYKTLRELIESSEEYKEILGPIYIKLTETVSAVKKVNTLNMKLLETRLSTIRFLLEKIGISEQNGEYKKLVRMRA